MIFFSQPNSPQATVDNIAANLETILAEVDRQAESVAAEIKANPEFIPSNIRGNSFFVYDSERVISWSDNRFVPTLASVSDTFKLKVLKAGNGDYLAKKWKIDGQRFIVGIVPLFRKFNITNSYLKTWWNRRLFPYWKHFYS